MRKLLYLWPLFFLLTGASLFYQSPNYPSGAAFTPASLTNLKLWLDANNSGSLSLDGSNNVISWLDQSSNAYSFAAGGARPRWNASQIGGKPALNFTTNASASLTNAVSLLTATAQAFSIWMVVKSGTAANAPNNLYIKDSSGNALTFEFYSGASFLHVYFGSTAQYPGVRASADFGSDNTWYALGLTYSGSGAVGGYQFYKSGGATATTVSGGTDSDTATVSIVGNYKSGSGDASGDIAEVIMQTSVATGTEISKVFTYFNTKYGL